jgi:predicted DNA-binding transcriptional regulator AlpA
MTNPVLPSPEEKPLLDLLEAARVLGIGRTMAYQKARQDDFPVEVLRIVGRLKVRNSDLRRYLGLDPR